LTLFGKKYRKGGTKTQYWFAFAKDQLTGRLRMTKFPKKYREKAATQMVEALGMKDGFYYDIRVNTIY